MSSILSYPKIYLFNYLQVTIITIFKNKYSTNELNLYDNNNNNIEYFGTSSSPKIEYYGFLFSSNLEDFIRIIDPLPRDISDYQNLYNSINNILTQFNSIDEKGFVNSTDISKLKVLESFIPLFISKDLLNSGNYASIDSKDLYKWIFNIIMLNFYYLSLKAIKDFELSYNTNVEKDSDFISDFKALNKNLFSKIDPSIRRKLQKRGITLTENIYTGFDTEYKNIDSTKNHLLSVQMVVNSHTFIKIPKYTKYVLSTLEALTEKSHIIKKSEAEKESIKYDKIENSINIMIDSIRSLKFCQNDFSMTILVKGLKHKGYNYIEQEDAYIFSMPLTPMERYIYYNDNNQGFTFKEMVIQSNKLGEPQLDLSYNKLMFDLIDISHTNKTLLIENNSNNKNVTNDTTDNKIFEIPEYKGELLISSDIESDTDSDNVYDSLNKKISRQFMTTFTSDRVSVTKIKNNYFIAHLTNADLSILNDFDLIKDNLDIVNKSFITLGKPFVYQNSRIFIRDTMLLAPAGNKSLESIGKLYGEKNHKKSLSREEILDMSLLLKNDKQKFQDYAIKDAEITLIHALWMENFNWQINDIGIPITLSSLGSKYVKNEWAKQLYEGYQIHPQFLIGDASIVQTPQGLLHNSDTGLKLSLYIGNYKGGRNESFMFGVDKSTYWYDYDLISAYTTAMSFVGDPDYSKGRILNVNELKGLSDKTLIYSYIIIKCAFQFPVGTKYPSIPCYVDETTTAFPLNGSCLLTGSEYVLAKAQNCTFNIHEIYYIPFKPTQKPFLNIISNIQSLRREFPKGSISNLMYKEIGNSIYGTVVKGISDKRKFDIKTGKTLRMESSILSNPLIASWTTAFIRSVVGECLHNISKLGGKVVSVTTDGFITDIENLEEKLNQEEKLERSLDCPEDDKFEGIKKIRGFILLKEYQNIRNRLSANYQALEIKTQGKGIISWTTRGQLGIESQIKATTGFQSRTISKNDMLASFIDKMQSKEKYFEYIQTSLRSAKEIYKKGGHVTMTYKDQMFRLQYDNRRRIIVNDELENNFDWSNQLLDSNPVKDVEECKTLRYLSKLHKKTIYNKHTTGSVGRIYKKYDDLAIRNFVKGFVCQPPNFGLKGNEFKEYNDLINFILEYKPKFKISKSSISHLKNRKLILKGVPRTKETELFVVYVKKKIPHFNENEFF